MQENRNRHNIIAIVLLALITSVCGIGFSACSSSRSETEPAPTSTIEATLMATAPPEIDDSWSRIEVAGKMTVGTSADYPPFEYYTKDFELVGFDVALIREIGQLLGVEVEIVDMAFSGLGNALQLNEIDLAISAISVTAERERSVDFGHTYFVTEDAILSSKEAKYAINSPEDLRGRLIGVQDNSVHQTWAQTELVDTGLVGESSLVVYRRMDKAINDLELGYLDLIILDLPPAEVAVANRGFVIAGQGLNRQRFGIAVANGATSLQAKLNQALNTLQNRGRIEELAQEFLGLEKEDLIPIPTPDPAQPTPTPVPTEQPQTCIDGMRWAGDLTYDDKDMTQLPQLAPGRPFVKAWRVRNTGTCTWDNTYALVYAGGNNSAARMGGEPAVVDRLVKPGEEYDFNVNLVSPLIPGVYQASWTMRNGKGQLFGDKLWVGIEVATPATVTPAPTQTPSPLINFSVDRTQIRQGECVTFSWHAVNVETVFFYADGVPWRQNAVPPSGQSTECPPRTTTFNLRVVYLDGQVEVSSIRIFVEPAPANAPVIDAFSVFPEFISVGQCVEITWGVSGEVDNVRISRNSAVLWEPAPVAGRFPDCPPGSGTMAYSLEATGPGGTSRAQHNVNVAQPTTVPTVAPNTPTPVPPTAMPTLAPGTPTPPPPAILAFAVEPQQIKVGQCVEVSYRTGGGTELVQILRNGLLVLDGGPLEASGQDCLNTPGEYAYRLIASNSAGQSDEETRTVNVTE